MPNRGTARVALYDNTGAKVASGHVSLAGVDGNLQANLAKLTAGATSAPATVAGVLAAYTCGADKFGGAGGNLVVEIGGTAEILNIVALDLTAYEQAFGGYYLGAGASSFSIPVKSDNTNIISTGSATAIENHGLMNLNAQTKADTTHPELLCVISGGPKGK